MNPVTYLNFTAPSLPILAAGHGVIDGHDYDVAASLKEKKKLLLKG